LRPPPEAHFEPDVVPVTIRTRLPVS
jgi:hypothetical protein